MKSIRRQRIGGFMLLGAIALAVVFANSPLQKSYFAIADLEGLKTVALALFFLNVGLELRHEIKDGILQQPKLAIVPFAAAVTGMVLPATIFGLLNLGRATSVAWPTVISFDVAFALAVLSIAGGWLPRQARAFVLSVAVIDDTLAILVLALFFATSFNPIALVSLAALSVGLFAPGLYRIRPQLDPAVSLVALPLFGFMSAGVVLGQLGQGFDLWLFGSIAVAILIGKPAGILGGTWLVTKSRLGKLDDAITWPLLRRVAPLFAMCFTISLLMSELTLGDNAELHTSANAAIVLVATAMAIVSAVWLRVGSKKNV
ncbi:MAG: Na+/H+ antiporter NhaA [Micrococcales bacterium]